ncbi:MFS transporter [Sphingomonas sp.]|uniref:MFS transporter n=1 Tax=Sphingomonas sp. TaxID=28214 RepID=UPI001B20719B|nr:MFS transporter [Sphingomonas sp.]MBO9711758.1 MFS transporter [Sphingomonas sp.]
MRIEAAASPPYPSRRSAWYVCGLVFLATMFGFLDRQILAILVGPIKHDLGVSDSGMSLLYGFAFVFLYSTLGLPIGRWVDRGRRKYVLAAGVGTWSVMTMLCGTAPDYWWLFVARMGVGVSEACLTPAACSLIADCFRPRERGRAMSFYLLGVYVGIGLSLVAGGLLPGWLAAGPALPLIGGLAPWRTVFVVVGAPGLAIAALVLTMREPARQDMPMPAVETEASALVEPGFLAYVRAHARVMAGVFLAHGLLAFTSYSVMAWAPSMLIRQFAQPAASVGVMLGTISALGGIAGALLGAFAADHWTLRGVTAAKFRICAAGAAGAALGLALLPFAGSAVLAIACVALCLTALPFASASGQVMVQEMFPNRLRGQGSALMVLLLGLGGAGCGPLVVGLASDHLFGPKQLSFAVPFAALPAALAVILLYFANRDGFEALRRSRLAPGGAA